MPRQHRIEVIETGTNDGGLRFIIDGIHRFYCCRSPGERMTLLRDLMEIEAILCLHRKLVAAGQPLAVDLFKLGEHRPEYAAREKAQHSPKRPIRAQKKRRPVKGGA